MLKLCVNRLFTASIVALFIFTTSHANAGSTRQPSRAGDSRSVAACIEAGRDNGDSDEEIAGRCLPDPALDSLSDYE